MTENSTLTGTSVSFTSLALKLREYLVFNMTKLPWMKPKDGNTQQFFFLCFYRQFCRRMRNNRYPVFWKMSLWLPRRHSRIHYRVLLCILLESIEMSKMWDIEAKTSENKRAPLSRESRICKDAFIPFNPLSNFVKYILFHWEDSEAGISGSTHHIWKCRMHTHRVTNL